MEGTRRQSLQPLAPKGFLLLWLPAALSGPALAAETAETIDDLRVPVTPAFQLFNTAPTAVERPGTPRAFGLSLLSSLERSDSSFPKDLALEFAPYWWSSHPDLTFEKYYDGDDGQGPSLADTVLRTFAFSLATVDLKNQTGVAGTSMGIGARFLLVHGRPARELGEKVDLLKAVQIEFLDECVPDDPEEPVDEDCQAAFEARLREAGAAVAKLDKERRGWLLEAAGAWAADFPDDDTSQRTNERAGAWLTASYNGKPRSLAFLGTARYIRQELLDEKSNRYDVGARVIWKADRDAMPPLALSAEYLHRFTDVGDDTDRLVAVLEYSTPLDNIAIIASYGKAFGDDFTGRQDLVAVLGVNFGFGRGPIVPVPPLSVSD